MSNYCPKCCNKLKTTTRWNEDLGYLAMLSCPSGDFFFEYPDYFDRYNDGSNTRKDARKLAIDEFNKKYNPYKVKEINYEQE